ncbi:type 1 glutamine amidotransferase [Corynebacterium mendelii]|uniref:Lipid II isoglutaminyl synthase (glutamine-hydrolyzing) subunit GatD n=1 Tax=Corynebacterium mendelii TaxID=2765362 RepID=A0A939DYT0_9CORY|nr:glutamine amidotransferase [Corynebacterium mendelii]MBN9643735.1 glutamine amidotransferase [Corynebacterium mendelii]
MSTLQIGLILPEVLGTYGDDGNALVLRQRARMRGIPADIVTVHLGDPVPDSLDMYCIGGGEDTAQIVAAEYLREDGGLAAAAGKKAPIVAICAGMQILGRSFRASGKMVPGLSLLDITTGSLRRRTIGEVSSTPTGEGITAPLTAPLTGFENHLGATLLGGDARALGTVMDGVGNCDGHAAEGDSDPERQTTAEGVVQGSVIATYMHGPALARNPQLADLVLARALGIDPAELSGLDMPEVVTLRRERLRRDDV